MRRGLILLLLSLAAPVQAADPTFVDGLAAYDAGNYGLTVRIWRQLADQGDTMAQLGLAGLHRSGEGVSRDLNEAARLYRLAAEQGHPDAQVNLARLHLAGDGVRRDLVEAHAWLSLAADQGKRYARHRLVTLVSEMTGAQLEAAAARLAELRAGR